MFRTALALLASMALAAAQSGSDSAAEAAQATPTPASSPEATPSPSPAAEASPSPESTPAPDVSPAPEASPVADASPAPESSPATAQATPGEDIIPLPEAGPAPEGGAPLETDDIVPVAPQVDTSADASFVDPNAFVSSELPPEPPAGIAAAESALERQRKIRIRYRDVRVQVEKDPQVVEMKQKSDNAKSPEGKRAALREYYRMVSQRISAMDASLSELAKAMEDAYIRRMAQTRLEPTIPLEPPPTPAPLN